jgi:hypothetical protein
MSARPKPTDWRRRAVALHRRLGRGTPVGLRLRRAAEALLGAPYVADSLVGGPDRPEQLVVRLDAFDCVTLVESALALARSATAAGFREELVRTRYRAGEISWPARLHYFSDWLRCNARRGALRLCARGAGARGVEARLAMLAGLPPRGTSFALVPRPGLPRARARVPREAIVAFGSLRAGLDFFHTGLLFADEERQPIPERTLVHAARSAGGVVAEPLGLFLRRNRTRGLAFAAPLPGGGER